MFYRIRPARRVQKLSAFTLVELLVVIGIIALLISILLPALSKARDQANTIKCLSNVRQLALAAKMFAADHQGCIPTDSDNGYATLFDPYHQKFYWRNSGGTAVLADWASSLLPYLGLHQTDADNFQNETTNPTPGWVGPRVLVCPTDTAQDASYNPGYLLINNVTGFSGLGLTYATQNFPISYGINADIASIIDLSPSSGTSGYGVFNPGGEVRVTGGPGNSQSLQCRIDKVAFPSQTLLFADCGTKPPHTSGNALDWNDGLYYTTNSIAGNSAFSSNPTLAYTLLGSAKISWLQKRIPATLPQSVTGGAPISINDRHKGKINIAFCDGHAESVAVTDFARVRISPYK
jgi:prepilin-type processing-associated H-X9-DG protein